MKSRKEHLYYLKRCFQLAEESKAKGESPVGSLVVVDGVTVAEATEWARRKQDVTCHAEVEAIREVVQRLGPAVLVQAILYSSHEPCILCSYVIRHYQIKQVVYAVPAGEIGGHKSNFPLLSTESITKWGAPTTVLQLDI